MRLSTSFFALALISVCAAVPFTNSTTGSLAKRSVHCETSGVSPSTADAVSAAQSIQSLGNLGCWQQNEGGSFCTTMWCTGTACVGISLVAALVFARRVACPVDARRTRGPQFHPLPLVVIAVSCNVHSEVTH
ncbi:hypothetical protein FB451DRAFT_1215786 [Mycena latifolia]|nr:hypothetical protein FB451DRAFT_1215786 [Mycena latifolia]